MVATGGKRGLIMSSPIHLFYYICSITLSDQHAVNAAHVLRIHHVKLRASTYDF